MCVKSEVEEILFKLATNDQNDEAFLLTKILALMGCLLLFPRVMFMYKITKKNVHKIRGQSYFFKHATSDQRDKTFVLHQQILPKGCLFLSCGFIYMYEIKQNTI